MNKTHKLLWVILSIIVAAVSILPAAAHGEYSNGIIGYNLQKSSSHSVQEWIDGDLTDDAGLGSEWYIIALSKHGDYDFSNYNNALNKYLSKNEVGSASSRLKYALTYVAIGDKTNPYINKALGNSVGEQGIMSLVFGLHLLNNGCRCDAYSVNGLIDELLSLQLADGGFSVMGEYGDIDVTAMTVQALAIHYNSNSAVRSAVDDALDFLSVRQLADGGYSAYGVTNPESSAQVIIALSSLKIDVCNDDRFVKNGKTVFDGMNSFRLADGSFCHREGGDSDSTATSQVFSALIAYENMKNCKSSFYIFNQNKNDSEATTDAIITETVVSQSTAEAETSAFVEYTSESACITIVSESDAQKTETEETRKDTIGSAGLTVILVCAISILLCAVLFATKKHKFAVLVIVAAVAVIALSAGVYGDNDTDTIGSVTISINCGVIKNENKSYIPESGVILEETEIEIETGDTVYDVLAEVCKENGIIFSSNMGYIEGINNIYEMDFGKSSGWIYFVNGESPSIGCGNYELSDGDNIQWHYTCDMGKDLDIVFEK